MRHICFLLVLAMAFTPLLAAAQPTTPDTIEQYLKKLHLQYKRGQSGEFEFSTGFPDARAEKFLVRALPEVKVVYIAILDVAKLPAEAARQAAAYRAIAELNYRLLIGKVEVEPDTNSVRLSFSFANENGVDFATFQAVVQSLLASVDKVREGLRNAR